MAENNESDKFGLDKTARLRAERIAEIEGREVITLEPEFPWSGSPAFDPDFFEIPANPET